MHSTFSSIEAKAAFSPLPAAGRGIKGEWSIKFRALKYSLLMLVPLFLAGITASAQTELLATFRGLAYSTNASGIVVSNVVTEQTFLQSTGITPLNSIALAYHVGGSGFGDTLDIVYTNNGAVVTTLLGFFFGDNSIQNVGRTALTNSTLTEVRRLDYIYNGQSSDARGGAFITKRYVSDKFGNVRPTMDGVLEWLDWNSGSPYATMYTGTFTTGKILY